DLLFVGRGAVVAPVRPAAQFDSRLIDEHREVGGFALFRLRFLLNSSSHLFSMPDLFSTPH
ncbi:MAG: hypothetical protein ACQER4_08800, partial [Bacteroidota bacterium]